MGSIIMHLCIANEVDKELNIKDDKFYIGNMKPDTDKLNGVSRIDSHYIKQYTINGKLYELPDIEKFIKENRNKLKDDNILLGYLSHLIADEIWYKIVSDKYTEQLSEDKEKIKIYNQEEILPYSEFKRMIYEDYANTNNYLIRKYNIDIDKIYNSIKDNKEFDCIKDFLIESKEYKENIDLNIINIEDILEWVQKSKQKVIEQIKNL